MSGKTIVLSTRPRGKPIKKLPDETTVASDGPPSELYHRLAAQSGLAISRLRITKGSDGVLVPNSKNGTIAETGLRDQSAVYVKDLGPQISWQTVFLLEYLGPIIVHPLIYFLRPVIYNTLEPPSELQTLTLFLVTGHFLKRELETLFIHRFSLASMPASNLVRNSAHYWFLSGLNLAYWVYAPNSPTAEPSVWWITYPALALFLLSEFGNFYTHLTLRNLRSQGGTERGIPQGYWFSLVTCPNYMFEVLAWIAVGLITRSWSLLPFMAVAITMMWIWGKGKENKYRREFGARYQKKSFAILPGLF